jgi:hypothetical protein
MGYFRHDFKGIKIEGTDKPWLFTSGCLGLVRCAIPVRDKGSDRTPGLYTVRLGFRAAEGDQPGRRVCDIKLQGRIMAKEFDLAQAAGGAQKAVIQEFKDVAIDDALLLELVPKATNPDKTSAPILNCVEIIETGQQGQNARVALFDGKTLNGWTVLKCEATVDNGDVLIVSGNGLIQTEKKYHDFVLEFEWKPLRDKKWDSGIYFRYDSVPPNRPWPARYQANLMQGDEGNVSDLPTARSKGLIQAGQWNRFKLTVHGTKAALEINGTPAWEADGLTGPTEGYIALQAEVPGGGQHRFRNIYVTELK